MGVQTDLFIGTQHDAKVYNGNCGANSDCVQLGGLTNLEFETLWAIIAGQEWDSKRHRLEMISSTEDSWTFRFPAAYVAALSSLDDEAIGNAAAAWAVTEEIAADPSDVLPVIQSLTRLSQAASAQGRDLFLWMSL